MLPTFALGVSSLARGREVLFAPPATPMRLSRALVRDLPDGAEIAIKRSWTVIFTPAPGGFTLSGQQTSVEVDTPPTLEFLAQIEQERIETGLFPITLSSGGMITTGRQGPTSEAFDRAVMAAARHINRSELSADNARLTVEALSALQKSAGELTRKLPGDLFRPRQPHWRVDRNIELPNGLSGNVEVTFDARMDAAGQLMEECERRIVSSIGGSSRTSSEMWELVRT